MDDYINRQAAIDYVEENKRRLGITNCNAWNFKDILRAQPAADVAPVVRGKWIRSNNEEICLTVKCSVCGMSQPLWAKRDYEFCPDCGAKMDKEDTP